MQINEKNFNFVLFEGFQMSFFFNLHNDLLGLIELSQRKLQYESYETQCSLPQLREGNVKLDVLALGAITQKGSTLKVTNQLRLYEQLIANYSDQVVSFKKDFLNKNLLSFLFAIENASGILEEDEPIELAFSRLEQMMKLEHILYISLTWNQENRFGGGNKSTLGLKSDGKELLRYISGKKIAVDLSHTSDALAHDILNLIDLEHLNIPVVASHSNFRSVCNVKRNLPDELALEVIRRKGLIGFNFVKHFVGEHPHNCFKHIEYGLKLGAENNLALGADFFGGLEVPSHLRTTPCTENPFFEKYSNESCFPLFFDDLKGSFTDSFLKKLAYQNVLQYLLDQKLLNKSSLFESTNVK